MHDIIQMLDEFRHILKDDNAISSARAQWSLYVPKIISQAKLENGARLVSRRSALTMDESDGKVFTKINGINDVHNVILNMYMSTENNPLAALSSA